MLQRHICCILGKRLLMALISTTGCSQVAAFANPEPVRLDVRRNRCRFLGRRALGLCDTDRCLASEKRSSGKSWGWSGWIDCCYGDLRNACVFAQS